MKTILLIAGIAAVGLAAGASQAATHHRHHDGMASAGVYAEPKTPIAYTELAAYLKASPRVRVTRDWGGEMAATTGTNVNAAATTAAPPAPDTSTQAAAPAPDAHAAQPPAAAPAQPPSSGATTQPAQPQ